MTALLKTPHGAHTGSSDGSQARRIPDKYGIVLQPDRGEVAQSPSPPRPRAPCFGTTSSGWGVQAISEANHIATDA
jgi:hypothetical protein